MRLTVTTANCFVSRRIPSPASYAVNAAYESVFGRLRWTVATQMNAVKFLQRASRVYRHLTIEKESQELSQDIDDMVELMSRNMAWHESLLSRSR